MTCRARRTRSARPHELGGARRGASRKPMPRRASFGLAVPAQAVGISREGTQIVVRPDEDELLKDVEVTGSPTQFTIAKRYVVDPIGMPHAGPGCDATGAPKCAIDNATSIKIELGEGDQE